MRKIFYSYSLILVTAVMFITAFSSCHRKAVPTAPIPQLIIKDSIIEKTIISYRDTVITVPGDTVTIVDTLYNEKDCPNVKPITIIKQGNTTNASVFLDKGKLKVICKTDAFLFTIDSLRNELRVKEKYYLNKEIKVVEKIVQVPKRYIPWWAWWTLAYTLVSIVWIFRNPILVLLKKIIKW